MYTKIIRITNNLLGEKIYDIEITLTFIHIYCDCRFVNLVDKSNFTEVEIWRHIYYLRLKRIKGLSDANQEKCISCNVDKLAHLLKMRNISEEVNEELSKFPTKFLDKMFLKIFLKDYINKLYMDHNQG